ncbi:MAG: hypothetical protein ACYTDT_12310 [Planctomycetota bacterium]|jgi:hypothetical protein
MSDEKKVHEAEIVGHGEVDAGQGDPMGAMRGMDPVAAIKGISRAKSKMLKFGVVFMAVAVFAGYVGATADGMFFRIVSIIGSGITGLLGMFMLLVYWRLRKFKIPGM